MTRFYSATPFSNEKFFVNINVLHTAIEQLAENNILDKEKREEFVKLLKQRTNVFYNEHLEAIGARKNSKAKNIKTQYNHFYYTLQRCFKEPNKVDTYIYQYHNPRYYEPVGCKDYIRPSNVAKGVAGTFIGLGILSFIGGAAAIPFCLPLALPLMAVGVIAVLAASFYLLGSTRLNPEPLKRDEQKIFREAAGIVKEQRLESTSANQTNYKGYQSGTL